MTVDPRHLDVNMHDPLTFDVKILRFSKINTTQCDRKQAQIGFNSVKRLTFFINDLTLFQLQAFMYNIIRKEK